jgi:hypothetical protein
LCARMLAGTECRARLMTTLKNRVEELYEGAHFQRWLEVDRFLEAFSEAQLEEIFVRGFWPHPLPRQLPAGMSRLDGLDRKVLIKLWKDSEREIARIMVEIASRNEEERRFQLHHGHWPEQICDKTCLQKKARGGD